MTFDSYDDENALFSGDENEQDETHQILTFSLGKTTFAIEVHNVREVLDYRPISPLPNAPNNLIGIIDVRNESVPVIDLKGKLRIYDGDGEIGPETRIVVLETGTQEQPLNLAIVADAVHEVADYDPTQLEEAPRFGESWDDSFMSGLGRRNGQFLTLLDVRSVFRSTDMSLDGLRVA